MSLFLGLVVCSLGVQRIKLGLCASSLLSDLSLSLKKNPPPSFLHTCEAAKAVQELSEHLDRKIRQMVSVIKLFAFVEIEYFVLGVQMVFTWQMRKGIFDMDWFDAKLHKNELE